jgi:hypothetical protein
MIARALYQALRFFATWLQQPTIVEVADGIDVRPASEPASLTAREPRL